MLYLSVLRVRNSKCFEDRFAKIVNILKNWACFIHYGVVNILIFANPPKLTKVLKVSYYVRKTSSIPGFRAVTTNLTSLANSCGAFCNNTSNSSKNNKRIKNLLKKLYTVLYLYTITIIYILCTYNMNNKEIFLLI